uniref:protein-serine/threonine phosphatase n=1 Tax=Arcella intermedia TaxID=1963864 RepID=A0A6B2LB23_9EUKA
MQVKYLKEQLILQIPPHWTIRQLKQTLQSKTAIHPDRQKLMAANKKFDDTTTIGSMGLKGPPYCFMLVGTPDHKMVVTAEVVDVFDDFELDYWPDEGEIQDKLQREESLRNAIATTQINLISPIQPTKKLLVLDLDQTLFDFSGRRQTQTLSETMRPGLVEFLTNVYKFYNIAIWSATAWTWLEIKLIEFDLLPNNNFQFTFVLDKSSMFSVKSLRNGKMITHSVKPLAIIWSKLPQFNETNTLHVDDLSRNFVFNPKSGIKISPFKYSPETARADRELFYLQKYLCAIANVPDVTKLDHSKWKDYKL